MAGSGYKNFTTGSVLTASDVQNYLMDQSVMVFAGTASRGSAITSPSEGMVVYLSDTDAVQVYNGTSWSAVGGGAAVLSNTPTGTYTSGGTAYAYYEFTASGTATVTKAGFADVLVIGGGGGASRVGAGAGGHLYVENAYLPVASHTVVIGAGGTGSDGSVESRPGTASRVAGFFAIPGARGRGTTATSTGIGETGGSGSGGGAVGNAGGAGTSGQGNNGGDAGSGGFPNDSDGGGGGAGAAGGTGTAGGVGGNGGAGLANSITGSSVTRAGGGGGAGRNGAGSGGSGGGGAAVVSGTPGNGTANTGGGGGGDFAQDPAGNGGSGIVIIRVRT